MTQRYTSKPVIPANGDTVFRYPSHRVSFFVPFFSPFFSLTSNVRESSHDCVALFRETGHTSEKLYCNARRTTSFFASRKPINSMQHIFLFLLLEFFRIRRSFWRKLINLILSHRFLGFSFRQMGKLKGKFLYFVLYRYILLYIET